MPRTHWFAAWGIPLFLGLVFAMASDAAVHGLIHLDRPYLYGQALLYALLFGLLFNLLFRHLYGSSESDQLSGQQDSPMPAIQQAAPDQTHARPHLLALTRFHHQESPKVVGADAIRILCCWLPYMVLLSPGALFWDTGDQLAQYFGLPAMGHAAGVIWDHHPFFDTFLYGWFAQAGHALAGSYEIGLFGYAVLQAVCYALVIAWTLAYLASRSLRPGLLGVFTAFFCCFPPILMLVMTISKDATHAPLFLLWALLFAKLVDSRLELLRKPLFCGPFILLSILTGLTKKTGLYIVALSLVILVLGHYRKRLKVLAVAMGLLVFLLINMLIPRYLFPVLHVVPGERQASIVMPLQLMARVAADNPPDGTAAEKQALDDNLSFGWQAMGDRYEPYIADPITGHGSNERKGSIGQFARLWLGLGLHHPLSYLNGFMCLESGWLSFTGPASTRQPLEPYPRNPLVIRPITHSTVNPETFGRLSPTRPASQTSQFVDRLYQTLLDTPLINASLYVAPWTSILPTFLLYALWRRRKQRQTASSLIQTLPYLLSIASLYCYAVSVSIPDAEEPTRYMFHALLLAPLAMGLLQPLRNSAVTDAGEAISPAESTDGKTAIDGADGEQGQDVEDTENAARTAATNQAQLGPGLQAAPGQPRADLT